MVFVHGFLPILILGFSSPFWENGSYVAINAHLPYIYKGRNNDFLDQFRWNLIMKVIIMVLTLESYVDNFCVLTMFLLSPSCV